MGRKGTDFEEKFDDVMKYAKVRLHEDGTKVNIRNKEDLRSFFERLDDRRRDKKGNPRMSDRFINGLVHSHKASRVITRGSSVGPSGGRTVRQLPPQKKRGIYAKAKRSHKKTKAAKHKKSIRNRKRNK
jgi:hypothetical protein